MSSYRLSLALLSAAALAGCAGLHAGEPALQSAYVIVGIDGAATARAIVTSTQCPRIEIDGRAGTMAVRSPLS
ncbi:MAG: hypothetical protein WCC39_18400, partial [Telluria sp.]